MLCAWVPCWALLPFVLVCAKTSQGVDVAGCKADFDSVSLVQVKTYVHSGAPVSAAARSPQRAATSAVNAPTTTVVISAQATPVGTTPPPPVTTRAEVIDISLNIPAAAAPITTLPAASTGAITQAPLVATTTPAPTTRTMVINIYLDNYTSTPALPNAQAVTTTPDYKALMDAQAAQQNKSQQMVSQAQAQANQVVAQAKTPEAKVEAQKQANTILARAKVAATPAPVPAPVPSPVSPQQSTGSGDQTSSSAPPPTPSTTSSTNSVVPEEGSSTPAPPPYLSPVSVNMNGTNVIVTTTASPPLTMEPLANMSAADLTALNASRAQARLDCTLSPWGDWSVCADESGMAAQYSSRKRTIVNPQQKGGRACTEPVVDQVACPE